MCIPLSQAGPVSPPYTANCKMEEKDWFRTKRYPHIGMPLLQKDKFWVTKYVQNKLKVATHNFYPFIHRRKMVRKYRRKISEDGTRSVLRFATSKPRDLYYANHLDANLYSYYSKLLNEVYNRKLKEYNLDSCVTSYRRIRINEQITNSGHKSNSDFAAEVFNFILKNENKNLVAITFDIKAFFDTLNHKRLKKSICNILEVSSLDDDYYNIFKNITNFSFINENQLFNEFSNEIIVKSNSGLIKKIKIKKRRYMKNQKATAFCNTGDFKKRILEKNLVINNNFVDSTKTSPRLRGIPQGSPISAVLANIYMLNFDRTIQNYISQIGGLYRRYSDDMVIICLPENEDETIKLFQTEISECELEIQPSKTQIFSFTKTNKNYTCKQKYKENIFKDKNFEYLGFEFNGTHSFIKSASLSGFYRKMKKSVLKGIIYSRLDKSQKGLFLSRLYRRFSYKGASRIRTYIKNDIDGEKWIFSHKYNWGNFLTYANRAQIKLPNNKIEKQLSRHWNILNSEILKKYPSNKSTEDEQIQIQSIN